MVAGEEAELKAEAERVGNGQTHGTLPPQATHF